jgi:hypothetical protein
MVRMASKRGGAREMPAEGQLGAARRELGTAHPELPRAGILAPARVQSVDSTDWGSASLLIALPPEARSARAGPHLRSPRIGEAHLAKQPGTHGHAVA